jgi:hypothetical protein
MKDMKRQAVFPGEMHDCRLLMGKINKGRMFITGIFEEVT